MQISSIDRSIRNMTENPTFKDAANEVHYKFDTEQELNDFIALFPKYCKIKKQGLNNDLNGGGGFRHGAVINFESAINTVTGDINETAVKRVKKLKAVLETIEGA